MAPRIHADVTSTSLAHYSDTSQCAILSLLKFSLILVITHACCQELILPNLPVFMSLQQRYTKQIILVNHGANESFLVNQLRFLR